jgi:hypothetical protein
MLSEFAPDKHTVRKKLSSKCGRTWLKLLESLTVKKKKKNEDGKLVQEYRTINIGAHA